MTRRITVIPFWDAGPDLHRFLPFDLGHGLRVENLSGPLSTADLSLWNRYVAPEQQKRITESSFGLSHRFVEIETHGPLAKQSLRLCSFVLGHSRFIVPHRTTSNLMVQGTLQNERIEIATFAFEPQPLILEDSELSCSDITAKHFEILKGWMPWVARFEAEWSSFYPLFLSLHFSEKAYAEEDIRVRNLLRVVAIEALFASPKTYGKNALLSRAPLFLGANTDLYRQYRSDWRTDLPVMELKDAITHVCDLRNEFAHGSRIPADWLEPTFRTGLNYQLCYADALREAATSIISLSWKKIISENLQETFADKKRMQAYFKRKPKTANHEQRANRRGIFLP